MQNELSNSNPVIVEGRPVDPGKVPPIRSYRFIAPGYHEALGTGVVAGRTLTWADGDSRARVVVVNEELARQEFGEPGAAVGRRLRDFMGGDFREIIGVTESIRYAGMGRPPPAVVYWPLAVANLWGESLFVSRGVTVVVRTRADPAPLFPAVREVVWLLAPNLPLADVRTLAQIRQASMGQTAFAMVMLSIAAAVALGLGLIGIYGVISYVVSQRTREIGLRIALGAAPASVRRMVVGQAAGMTAIGVGGGLLAAASLTRLMSGLLYGVRPLDLVTYAAVSLVITAVALAAAYLPARRAAGVDPVAALRD
jgi:ABC-type antimicrobial peptide transport system permease subunit